MLQRAALLAGLALLAAVPAAPAAPVGTPETIASGLETPWEVVPDAQGRTLVTEIVTSTNVGGRITAIAPDGTTSTAYSGEPNVTKKFLGLALAPDYATATPKHVYLYETRDPIGTDPPFSRIVRLVDDGTTLTFDKEIFTGIGSDLSHDGGRMVFGPGDHLYVTTGDMHQHDRPQNPDNLNGKILRMTKEGEPVAENPFNDGDTVAEPRDFVYSLGHRHPQGLAWDAAGRLWETEHGPSGEGPPDGTKARGHDELNLIVKGGNYGWPEVIGDDTDNGTYLAPKWHSGPAPALAPGGLAISPDDGLFYVPGLNGRHLHVFRVEGGAVTGEGELYDGVFGRMRTAVAEPGHLWLTTHSSPMRVLRVAMNSSPVDFRADEPPPTTTTTTTTTPAPQPPIVDNPIVPRALPPLQDPRQLTVSVLRRVTSALDDLRLRTLLRRGSVGVRAGGFAAGGRVTLRLQLRRAGRAPLTVASGVARPQSRAPVTIRATLTRRGRATLKRLRRARLIARVAYAPPGAAAVTRTATISLNR